MMTSWRLALTGFALIATASLASAQLAVLTGVTVRGTRPEVAAVAEAASNVVSRTSSVLTLRDDGWDIGLPHTAVGDNLLSRAEVHFNNGRTFYFEGMGSDARREFDLAVDTLLNAPESLADRGRIERRLDELCDLVYRFDVENLGSGQARQQDVAVFDKAPIDEISHMTFPVDESITTRLKTELNQTTSGIPLELADPVISYVHYFSSDRGRNILLSGFRRSGRYKAMIQRVFAEEGVPQELIYLAQAESGFLPRAMSYKWCAGLWQFKAETGYRYQLARTADYDDRFDAEKATRAAARYLRDLYARYNDWYLAMAAYNCGEGAVDRAVERTGYADYWELLKRHALPKETSNYVPIIVAMTIIAKNPQDYGLTSIDLDPALEYDTLQLTAATNLNLIADATMQPLSVIRDLNPALLKTVAPSGFAVHIPKGLADTAQAQLDLVPAVNRSAWRLHHVVTGDTLDTIAKSYRLPAYQIASLNPASDSIEAGDVLLIPAAFHEEKTTSRSLLRASGSRSHAKRNVGVHHGTHLAASRHIPAQILHRRAAIRTANLAR